MTNIEKLARLILKLGNADMVLQSLPTILQQQKEGESEHE